MSKRKWIVPGCALLAIIVVGIIVISVPAALALRLAGFRAEGKTDNYLQEQSTADRPTIQWLNDPAAAMLTLTPPSGNSAPELVDPPPAGESSLPSRLDAVTVDIWFLSQPRTFPASEVFAERLERGMTAGGQLAYYLEFTEQGVNSYMNHWFGVYLENQDRIKNAWLDLRPDGAVIYADLNLELGWKRVGAVFMLDASGRQLTLIGVDIDGRLYSSPPSGPVAELTDQLETQGNRALRELAFLDPAGRLTIQELGIKQDRIQILAY